MKPDAGEYALAMHMRARRRNARLLFRRIHLDSQCFSTSIVCVCLEFSDKFFELRATVIRQLITSLIN